MIQAIDIAARVQAMLAKYPSIRAYVTRPTDTTKFITKFIETIKNNDTLSKICDHPGLFVRYLRADCARFATAAEAMQAYHSGKVLIYFEDLDLYGRFNTIDSLGSYFANVLDNREAMQHDYGSDYLGKYQQIYPQSEKKKVVFKLYAQISDSTVNKIAEISEIPMQGCEITPSSCIIVAQVPCTDIALQLEQLSKKLQSDQSYKVDIVQLRSIRVDGGECIALPVDVSNQDLDLRLGTYAPATVFDANDAINNKIATIIMFPALAVENAGKWIAANPPTTGESSACYYRKYTELNDDYMGIQDFTKVMVSAGYVRDRKKGMRVWVFNK